MLIIGLLPARAAESLEADTIVIPDPSLRVTWPQVAVPVAAGALSAVTVRAHWGVKFRHWVQSGLATDTHSHTTVDNYIQYVPVAMPFLLNACTYRGAHGWLDLTLLAATSYATFAVVNQVMKLSFKEKRPDSGARNSFPSGHTGTAFCGAEILRREYWERNKLVAMSGYLVATGVAYLRIHNDRHWINDVVAGAAVGYLSTTFAYWLYPRLFRPRARAMQRDRLLLRQHPQAQFAAMLAPAPGGLALAATITF